MVELDVLFAMVDELILDMLVLDTLVLDVLDGLD